MTKNIHESGDIFRGYINMDQVLYAGKLVQKLIMPMMSNGLTVVRSVHEV